MYLSSIPIPIQAAAEPNSKSLAQRLGKRLWQPEFVPAGLELVLTMMSLFC